MSEYMDMTVNRIPSLTWNWLHMNETNVEHVSVGVEKVAEAEVPATIEATTAAKTALAGKTGMGEDVSLLIEKSGVQVTTYTAKAGVVEQAPVRLTFQYEDGDEKVSAYDLVAEEGADLLVVQNFLSEEDAKGTAAIQTRYLVEKGARLHLVQIQKLGAGFDFLNDIGGEVKQDGNFTLTQVVLSGNHTWTGAYSELSEKHASLKTDIGYIVKNQDSLDMNYVANHTGRKTRCEINADGVLRNEAKKVFRGTIDFHRGCGGSKGDELENVLLMDDDVINQTIPVILCDEEDVEGNHGASIGKLDEGLLFYLESRGLNLEEIYEMMAKARIEAVAAKIPDEASQKMIREALGDVEE